MTSTTEASPAVLRRGPTYSLFVRVADRSVLILAGWRARHARWEGRTVGASESLQGFAGEVGVVGDTAVLDDLDRAEFELEVLDGEQSRIAGRALTDRIVGEHFSAEIWASARSLGSEPYTANRDLDIGEDLKAGGWTAVDLLICTLPTRRGVVGSNLSFASRWVRTYVGPRGIVTVIQSPPRGNWDDELVRWQHHAVHSRSEHWFEIESASLGSAARFRLLIEDLVAHQAYFARSWSSELELWEQRVYEALTAPEAVITVSALPSIEQEIGHLAGFLSQAQIANRNLERRLSVSKLIRQDQELHVALNSTLESLVETYESDRAKLRSAMLLLNTLVNSVQARATELQQRTTERNQHIVTIVTTLFLVPSLVIGLYGANLRELSPGSLGSLPNLGVWLLAALGISWSGLRLLEGKPVVAGRWWLGALGLFGFAACLLLTVLLAPRDGTSVVVASGAGVVVTLLVIVGALRNRRATVSP